MLIFIDSNILCSDYYLKSPRFELIRKVGTIVLGKIVIDEVCNKFKEQLEIAQSSLNKNLNSINKLLPNPLCINDITIESEVQKYREYLEQFSILESMSMANEYPDVSHERIVARALLRKKPFKQDGSTGYRDYLVWLTCLKLACSYTLEDIHFITQNTSDFSDSSNIKKLHDDLLSDLKEYNIDASRFFYWISIKEFFDNHIQSCINALSNKSNIISSIKSSAGYLKQIQDYLIISITGTDLSSQEVYLPGQNNIIKEIEEILDNDIEEISCLQEDVYILDIKVDCICLIEANMNLEEYRDLMRYEDCEIDKVEIRKPNLYRVYLKMGLVIHLNAKYHNASQLTESIQLDYIEGYNCGLCF